MEAGATIQVGVEAVLTEDSVAAVSEEEVPVAVVKDNAVEL